MTEIKAVDVAEGIAKELGNGWKVKRHPLNDSDRHAESFCQLFGPDESGIQAEISVDMRPGATTKGRLELRGVIPTRDAKGKYRDHGIKAPTITVDPSRPASKIAADMRRRLLPAYSEAFLKASHYIAECNVNQSNLEASLAELHKAAGSVANRIGDYDREKASFGLNGQNCYGTVQASEASATLELRYLPLDHAIQVLQLVARLEGKKGEDE